MNAPGSDFSRLPPAEARSAGGAWSVAHTLPRQEKALAEALVMSGVPCFLPLISHVRFYGHRKRTVEIPLFASYVFVFGTVEQSRDALRTKRVVQMLAVADQTRLDNELSQLDRAIAGGATLDPYPYLEVGKRVVVVRGPFQGIEGLIDERKSVGRLVLNVSLLGRATSLEIDSSLLEPMDEAAR